MGESIKKEAPFIADFKRNQEKKYNQFLKNRRVRFRSAVFDLPEFAKSPLVSMVIWVNSQSEWARVENFIKKNAENKDLQLAILYANSLVLPELNAVDLTTYPVNLDTANHSTWINQIAVKMSGKIICLMEIFEDFDSNKLFEMIDEIKENKNSQLWIHATPDKLTGLAMACDAYYLARGLDELIEAVEIAFFDLALRVEMSGAEVNSTFWSRLQIPTRAKKNIQARRLTVNQGSPIFGHF